MKRQNKKFLIIPLILLAGALLCLPFLLPKPETKPITASTQVHTIPQKKETYEDCIKTSESNYRAYLDKFGTEKTNEYNQPVRDLPREQWDKINTARANEYSACFDRYN